MGGMDGLKSGLRGSTVIGCSIGNPVPTTESSPDLAAQDNGVGLHAQVSGGSALELVRHAWLNPSVHEEFSGFQWFESLQLSTQGSG